MIRALILTISLVLLSGCDPTSTFPEMEGKFADQHFKTVIALVELHKLRNGEYPQTLAALEFTGDWDTIAIQSATYERVEGGYTLTVSSPIGGEASLDYPERFWDGLGILRKPKEGTRREGQILNLGVKFKI